jgi:hypothetical protein
MAGIRETKRYQPTRRNEDANGYILAYRNTPDGYEGSSGWLRTRVETMMRNVTVYPYWIPTADLALLPFHQGGPSATGGLREVSAEESTG